MTGITFSYPVTIKETYLDTFGHVNNAAYLILFEEARWEFITKQGYGLEKIRATSLGPTILSINIKFSKELRLREKIIIESRTLSYQKKIGVLEQKMLRDNDICCTAEFVIGLFSLSERKLVLPTPEWLHAIGLLS